MAKKKASKPAAKQPDKSSDDLAGLCHTTGECLKHLCCHLNKCGECPAPTKHVNPSLVLSHPEESVAIAGTVSYRGLSSHSA